MTIAALRAELDRWADGGHEASLWWRDDDAGPLTPALQRMLAIAQASDVPLAIAAIPATISDDAAGLIAASPRALVLQHGIAHRNHAPAGERNCELGAHRPPQQTAADLAQGRERMEAMFGDRFLPVLVPPWNRIAAEVVGLLPALGYRGVSTFGPRAHARAAGDVVRCNTHVDLIAWRRGRRFVGEDEASARLAAHLAMRREKRVDHDEPTGLLTHHADFDAQAWTFVERLFDVTRSHPAATWIAASAAFAIHDVPTSARSA